MKYLHPSESGFSLVETLVAITILLVVIVGPMSISSSAARSTSFASEQVIAFFLAQEGAELVQKGRDDLLLRTFLDSSDGNYLADPWSVFTDDSASGRYEDCYTTSGCGLELNTDSTGTLKTPIACTGTNCDLFFSATGERSRYTHEDSGTEDTPFSRIVFLSPVDDRSVRVVSRVYWRTGSQRAVQQVEVETYLFNVYEN